MPDDHSEVVPLLPIPNRTVKRLRADDSAGSRVKVGHRQASTAKTPSRKIGRFLQNLEKVLKKTQKACYNRRLSWSQQASQSKKKRKLILQCKKFVNNIQPISVGVWRRLPSSSELNPYGFTNAHEDRSEVHFNSVFMGCSKERKNIKIEL